MTLVIHVGTVVVVQFVHAISVKYQETEGQQHGHLLFTVCYLLFFFLCTATSDDCPENIAIAVSADT